MNYTLVFGPWNFLDLVEENSYFEIEILEFISIAKYLRKLLNKKNNFTVITGRNFSKLEYLNKLETLTGLNLLSFSSLKEEIYRIDYSENYYLNFSGKRYKHSGEIHWGKVKLIKPFPMKRKKLFFIF